MEEQCNSEAWALLSPHMTKELQQEFDSINCQLAFLLIFTENSLNMSVKPTACVLRRYDSTEGVDLEMKSI